MTVGEFIKNRRESLGLTMREVSEAVGVSEATVCRWESGSIGSMRQSRIAALADVLRVPPEQIVMADQDPIQEKASTGERIKELRKQKGMSAEVLAERCGYSAASMYRYEKGDIEKAEYTRLVKIAEALDTTPEYLLLGDVAEKDAADLDEKRQRLVESVKDMTDEQVDLVQQLVDQILRRR